ncbi:Microtubule-associated protein RP/EB family member 1B [Galdieria sulphuraria]|uniref:Microtubule-associated protein, RP/EB family n=1 Tax=Galdieria sulphuraria TaxID=130081 RepID=M2X121_GALSU|nr:microtubule-associated protein, RP/EB family [Galdieria sulphuraria]EME30060.1 microtubule-associated protein, RP/EB family [Galdieria sulphuraria]GJD06273.1 Microtubule-associated protein RP/EB family member 1B [Galdieria sulphuraria]|eukprot:XP_005706580.1 microtubule-associated protein, RP/EB family [Galdieria sulphuraria]
MSESIGMMEGAYFVGRAELLSWINNFLSLNYTKIEEFASGCAHCQVFDALFPGKVPLQKVNFGAKMDYEFIQNYKILQTAFDRCNIEKRIDVDKLVKAKYQDNLEFTQWVKCYFDRHYDGSEYDAVGRRNRAIEIYNAARGGRQRAKSASSDSQEPATVSKKKQISTTKENAASEKKQTSSMENKQGPIRSKVSGTAKNGEQKNGVHVEDTGVARAEVERLSQELEELRLTADILEKERDFYFNKLRDIEILCQQFEESHSDVAKAFQQVLYATEEDFINPEDLEVPSEEPIEFLSDAL